MDAHRVCVVGSGYVGTVVAGCLAYIGHDVMAVEIDPIKLESLRTGTPHFFEPGLSEILRDGLAAGRLDFTDEMRRGVEGADVIFICVETPTTASGHPDMSSVAAAARSVGAHLKGHQVIVTKSTVPIGSGQWLETVLEDASDNGAGAGGFSVVSNPEFLREGTAVEDFLYPDRVVIGSEDDRALDVVESIYRPVLSQDFSTGRDLAPTLVRTDLATAETIKYAANAFLATKISFINEIAGIAERVGADVIGVADAIGLDHRIGRAFLGAGVGWGGSCFGKDLDALSATARDYGLDPLILEAVREVNIRQRHVIVEKLQDHLASLRGRRIALLGIAFKPGTDDLRDAPAIDIARRLSRLGASVAGYDPVVKDVPDAPDLAVCGDALEAVDRADAVVLVTDWPEFRDLDWAEIAEAMRGRLLLDGRNFLDDAAIKRAGLRYEGIGRRVRATERTSLRI